MLCVWSGAGLALAGQPTNPAQNQYIEVVPTVHHPKHHSGARTRHRSTTATKSTGSTTTSTGAGVTPTHVDRQPPSTGRSTVHHRTTRPHHKVTRHRMKKRASAKLTSGRRAHLLSSKPTHGAARLTMAAATGSGGGMGIWLLVILLLVLVTGSTAGVLRYRRNHH